MENSVRIRILRCGTMTPPAAAYPGVPKRYVRRGRVELPVSAFLIETPEHKPVLVDTGWGARNQPRGRIRPRRGAREASTAAVHPLAAGHAAGVERA